MLSDGDLKAVYRNRNNYYRSIRSERNYPIKKRRLFSSLVNYDEGISSRKNSCFSPERGVDGDGSDFCRKIHGGNFTFYYNFLCANRLQSLLQTFLSDPLW